MLDDVIRSFLQSDENLISSIRESKDGAETSNHTKLLLFSYMCCGLKEKDIWVIAPNGAESAESVPFFSETSHVCPFQSFPTNVGWRKYIQVEKNFGFLAQFYGTFAGDIVPPMTYFKAGLAKSSAEHQRLAYALYSDSFSRTSYTNVPALMVSFLTEPGRTHKRRLV